jgi:hypothetical protein
MAAIGAMFPHKPTHPGTLDVVAAAAVGSVLEIPLVTEENVNMVDLSMGIWMDGWMDGRLSQSGIVFGTIYARKYEIREGWDGEQGEQDRHHPQC